VKIYCCACNAKVVARLTDGSEIYPHRPDLHTIPFWICDICRNFVGCHHKTKSNTRPLGCIPTPELRSARNHIHRILDPLWRSSQMKRSDIYKQLSDELGWKYHTAQIRTVVEARKVYSLVKTFYI